MQFHIISLFTKPLKAYFGESILKRAQDKGLISVVLHNLRDFSPDLKHHKVDAPPYGGGPGMVLQFEPMAKAVAFAMGGVAGAEGRKKEKSKVRVILFSTRGKKLDAKMAQRLAKYDSLVLLCGRYEGVDERVAKYLADEEVSLGDFVLSGGEIPAMALVDAVARFLPEVLGKRESLEEVKGSYPTYTRPEVVEYLIGARSKKLKVPAELLTGNHAKIAEWRKRHKMSF